MECRYKVQLFGRFSVQNFGKELDGLDRNKAHELFSYLLLFRHQPHLRESLASLLWQENPLKQGKKYLRKSLWQLQGILSPSNSSQEPALLTTESDWIQLNGNANIWLDIAKFEEAYERSRGIKGRDLNQTQFNQLCEAVKLYNGDLLEGWYQDWCIFERIRFQNMLLEMLGKLVEYAEVQHFFELGRKYAMQILSYDLAHEKTHRALMRLFYFSGDRTAALRQYEYCRNVLKDELAVEPTEITMSLRDKIAYDILSPEGIIQNKQLKNESQLVSHLEAHLRNLAQIEKELNQCHIKIRSDLERLNSLMKQANQHL